MVKPTSRRRQQAQAQGEEKEAGGQRHSSWAAAPGGVDGGSSSSAPQAPGCELADGVTALRLTGAAVPKAYPDPEHLTPKLIKDLTVGPNQAGLGITGAVVGREPQLLEKESQLLFWLADDESTLVQVRVMLCDKAGKLLPPSECRMLRAWVHNWFVCTRRVFLLEPTVRQPAPDAATVAFSKADVMRRLSSECADGLCWDVVGEREVVLEGGLQQVRMYSLDAPLRQLSQQQLSTIEREVAGLLGAHVYPGKQLAPFTDNQPMLITSLLLNAAACYLRDPSVRGDPALAPHNALHLAVTAMMLQPRYGKAHFRAACALGKMGDDICRSAAHTIMRYAAQLEGRPTAELLAQLPPLPPGAGELDYAGHARSALHHVVYLMFVWPCMLRARAPPGQDFLLQLPGGLGELPPSMVHIDAVACDAEAHVAAALEAKERGNTAFAAGDVRGALSAYHTGIDCLRPITARYLQRNDRAFRMDVRSRKLTASPSDRAYAVVSTRVLLLPLICAQLFPYQGLHCAMTVMERAALMFAASCPPLPAASRLPAGMSLGDMTPLVGSFWNQLTAKFMEPVGGVEGLLVNSGAWISKYHRPMTFFTHRFDPHGLQARKAGSP